MTKRARARARAVSDPHPHQDPLVKGYGSEDPDLHPDPYQNVTLQKLEDLLGNFKL
jgi:hypothetical protein